jgi:NAD-dependent deacetylase
MSPDFSQYKNIVVLTGAGISVASGLRAFRGPDGLWEEHQVAEYGHIETLQQQPLRTWQLFGAMRAPVAAAQPNPAHQALAQFEARLKPEQQFLLITQNVDGLHQKAGSKNVAELHGNIGATCCSNASCTLEPFADPEPHQHTLPHCPLCGSVLRPNIVLFGEALPAHESWLAKRALRDCDLFVAIGTSGTVSPAANFVRSAEYVGARTIYINLEPMVPRNPAFKEEYLGRAEEILPGVLDVDGMR